jgi:hypothetical protein
MDWPVLIDSWLKHNQVRERCILVMVLCIRRAHVAVSENCERFFLLIEFDDLGMFLFPHLPRLLKDQFDYYHKTSSP